MTFGLNFHLRIAAMAERLKSRRGRDSSTSGSMTVPRSVMVNASFTQPSLPFLAALRG